MKRSLRSWLWRVPLDQEVDEEIAFHIEMRTRELVDRGVDPRIAREMVLARLGDVGRLKRTCVDLGRKREREMRLTQCVEEFRADVTSAFRQMKASPGFTWSPRSRWRSASAPTARCSRLPTRPSFARCRSPRRRSPGHAVGTKAERLPLASVPDRISPSGTSKPKSSRRWPRSQLGRGNDGP